VTILTTLLWSRGAWSEAWNVGLVALRREVETAQCKIDESCYDLYGIGEDDRRKVFVRREVRSGGQSAVTSWRVERRLAGTTLLRLFPETGRRHQLRVHLAALGHPILGDLLYGRPDEDYLDLVRGTRDARGEEGAPARQLLHCARIVFPDPAGGGSVEVEAPLPADFAVLLEAR
jgi:23S rRNA-/tRNA-specific pseudouridylate synthase